MKSKRLLADIEITNMAIDCGALVKPHPMNAEITLVTFTLDELKEFISRLPKKKVKMMVVGGGEYGDA